MKILIIGDIYSIVGRQMLKYWIPKIRKNYILKEYIGTTKEQGRLNGPDFILENINNKKNIRTWNCWIKSCVVCFPNGVRDFEKVGKKLDKQINEQKGGNFYRNWINLIKIVEDKINKWKKFQKIDKKAIEIILNNSVLDIWYYIFAISFIIF